MANQKRQCNEIRSSLGSRGIASDPDSLKAVALKAEVLGYEHFGMSDHVIVATEVQSAYAYSKTGKFFAQDLGCAAEDGGVENIKGGYQMSGAKAQEPWQWPDEHWRKVVNQVRAGRSLRPKTWKGGARCAVALSFDSDHETSDLRDGGKSIGRLSWGQYGNRVGVPRILKLLDSHGIKASFYVPAVTALLHPDEQRRVVGEGHEIGIHGWIHELNSVLPFEAERELMLRSADTLEKITGKRAVGLRTPSWDFSPNTLRIEKELGLSYDSSLMADEDCYELLLDGEPTGIIEFPVEWVRDDAVYFMMNRSSSLRPYTAPTDVLDIFRRELDAAWDDGGIFQLTCHPHVIGYRSRIWILDELIRHAKSKGSVWFATHAEIVDWAKTHSA